MHNEVLRGTRLPAVPDRLSSSPPLQQQTASFPFPRNGALPPISYDQNDSNNSSGKVSNSVDCKVKIIV